MVPVAAVRVINDRGGERERGGLPGLVEGQLAVPAGPSTRTTLPVTISTMIPESAGGGRRPWLGVAPGLLRRWPARLDCRCLLGAVVEVLQQGSAAKLGV
jgi:hypothetical protein